MSHLTRARYRIGQGLRHLYVPPPDAGRRDSALAVLPEAMVFRKGQMLGKTPMFNLSLPAGTHLLTLIGDDKVKRQISVQIFSGKTAIIKMPLADVPAVPDGK